MKFAFIGAGAIGQFFAARIVQYNPTISVTVYISPTQREAINRNGITLIDLEGQIHKIKAITIGPTEQEMKPAQVPDLLVLTTKAYQNQDILIQYAWLFGKCPHLLILQNGLGNEQPFLEAFPNIAIYRGTTTLGALLLSPGQVRHTGKGITYIGCVHHGQDSFLNVIRAIFENAQLNASIASDIQLTCWEKIFVNVPINAFGALIREPNGALLQQTQLLPFMYQCLDEAIAVAQQAGIILPPKDYHQIVIDILQATQQNRNSMLVDIERGRPTEIDYINGYICQLGEQLQIPTPINRLITALIHALEPKE